MDNAGSGERGRAMVSVLEVLKGFRWLIENGFTVIVKGGGEGTRDYLLSAARPKPPVAVQAQDSYLQNAVSRLKAEAEKALACRAGGAVKKGKAPIEDALDAIEDGGAGGEVPPNAAAAVEAGELARKIEDLLESGDYDWAADTLEGILETVTRTGRITKAQTQAVENIEEGGQRRFGRMP